MKRQIILLSSEFPPGPGGIGDHAFNLARFLSADGFPVSVVTELRSEFGVGNENVNNVLRIHYAVRGKLAPNLKFITTYVKVLATHKESVVIATGSKSVMLAGVLAFLFRRPMVAILHGHEVLMGRTEKRWLLRNVLGRFSHAVSVSQFSKDNSRTYFDERKTSVIPNGIDLNKFTGGKAKLRNSNAIHLLTVGRISPRKGQLNVVNALPEILKTYPNAVFHMVGIPDAAESVRQRIQALNLNDHVVFHGVLSDLELQQVFEGTDIFLMMSENLPNGDVEGFGIAILEANWLGIPAVGSRGCGIEQAIKPGVNGFLADPHSPKDIAGAVTNLIRDYSTFSKQSIDWAKQHQWSDIVKQYSALLQQL